MTYREQLEQSINSLDAALTEKEQEIERLKKQIHEFNRWLSRGVYFTTEEYDVQVTQPKRALLAEAIKFAEALRRDRLNEWSDLLTTDPSDQSTEDCCMKDPVFASATTFLATHQKERS